MLPNWEQKREPSMSTLKQDLRYAVRMLRKNPGFTFLAVLTLALGIGVNTAMFSVVNAALLRPLPFPSPQELVQLGRPIGHVVAPWQSLPDFRDVAEQLHDVAEMGAMSPGDSYTWIGHGEPRQLDGVKVTSNLFHILGVQPILGRGFTAEDTQPGKNVVLIDGNLWKQQMGGDTSVIGRSITLEGQSYTIIGVLPSHFLLNPEAQVYLPMPMHQPVEDRSMHSLAVYGRLKPGWTRAQADARMAAISQELSQRYPTTDGGQQLKLLDLRDLLVRNIRASLLILMGAVCLVLLIACVNVANMLLARALSRQREIAIRAALGASRAQMIRQLLTESMLLSLMGGGLGIGLAALALQALRAFRPASLPSGLSLTLDSGVLLFTAVAAIVAGLLFGLAPALRMTRPDLNASLKDRSGQLDAHRGRLHSLLVVSEVALAMVLLVGAGLLIESLFKLREVNPGFQPDHVVVMRTVFPARLAGPQQASDYWMNLARRLEQTPGIRGAAVTSGLPMELNSDFLFTIAGQPEPVNAREAPDALFFVTSPGYLESMGIALLRGRTFTADDTASSDPVVVINAALAKKYFPNQDPVGQRLTIGAKFTPSLSDSSPRRIVGVVGNTAYRSLSNSNEPAMYVPVAQLSPGVFKASAGGSMALVVRLGGGSGNWGAALPKAVHEVDPMLPVTTPMPLTSTVSDSLRPQTFNLLLLGSFAGLALLLAAIGIYGVMAYAVTQRQGEIGVRMAMGASPQAVLRLIVRQGMSLAGAGVAAGIVLALLLTRFLATLLFGVSPAEPFVYVGLGAALALVALVANLVPALRAARVDPMIVLRSE